MRTLSDLKQELIDHLFGVDKAKLNMFDLKTYSEILKIMDEIERSNKPDKWTELLATMSTSGFGCAYKPADLKEVENNG